MERMVGLVQLHFLPGIHFTELDAPVTQFLLNISELPSIAWREVGDNIVAGPHLDDPEKAVVLTICYRRAGDEIATESALHPPSPIYAPITPYLRSTPRITIVGFGMPLNIDPDRGLVHEFALIRIPAYHKSDDEEDEASSNDSNNGDYIFVEYNESDSDDGDAVDNSNDSNNHTPANNNNNDDDDDDDDKKPATDNNKTSSSSRRPSRRPSSSTTTSSSTSTMIYSSSSEGDYSSSSPFAAALAGLDGFFSSATCTNAHRGPADLSRHRSGGVATNVADRPELGGAVLHAWTWVDEAAMRRFKDAARPNCYEARERRRLDERGEEAEEGDDLWQTEFVQEVEALRAEGAEVEVMAVRLRRFWPDAKTLEYEDE